MQSCGLCLCFPVAVTAVFFFSLLAVGLVFFVLFLVIPLPPFVFGRKKTYCSADGNGCSLPRPSSAERGGQVCGCLPELLLMWEPCSPSWASIGSVV